MTGDVTVASQEFEMTPNNEVYPNGWPQAMIWSVSSATGSYDVASFGVEFRTCAPVS